MPWKPLEQFRAEYAAKLRDPRWQQARLRIMERDGWKCAHCGAKDDTLNVHHWWYHTIGEPWENADEMCSTLCENCHREETELRPLADSDIKQIFKNKHWRAEMVYDLFRAVLASFPAGEEAERVNCLTSALADPEVIDALINAGRKQQQQSQGKA